MPVFEQWVLPATTPARDVPDFGLQSPHVAALLEKAGIRSAEEFRRFTRPHLDDLHDPSQIHGMGEACDRIEAALGRGEKIVIYGDYDVDGVTSIVLLKTVLGALGGEVHWVVPHRIYDGYGLTIPVLERVLEEHSIGLVITVDCGITSAEAVEHAIARGLDVIITDHHLPPETLPSATVVLNPKQDGCTYPYKELAGVGVAFKLCCELLRRAGHGMSIASLAKIAALGTIADVAPLTGENRTIARIGLEGLVESRNPGLRVLLRNLKLLGRPLRSFDVGFRIGPRINAAGRIGSADTAVQLFECREEATAFPLVAELERMNERRKALLQTALREAQRQAEEQKDSPILVVGGEDWHQGIVGLCAGRLSESYHRPVLAARIGEEECTGSGRSPDGVDLHAFLQPLGSIFRRWGGHARACGFSVARDRWEELQERLRLHATSLDLPTRRLLVAGALSFRELEGGFLEELMLLEPWGEGNPEPVFVSHGVLVESKREFAEDCWAIALSQEGAGRTGVVWPSRNELLDGLDPGAVIDCAYTVEGTRYDPAGVRLVIQDLRAASVRNEV